MDGIKFPPATPSRRRFRLRGLALIALLCSIPCGWLAVNVYRAWRQGEAVEAILKCPGCEIFYDRQGWVHDARFNQAIQGVFPTALITESSYNCDLRGCPWSIPSAGWKGWAECLYGPNLIRRVVTVETDLHHVSRVADYLPQLPNLKTVLVRTLSDDDQRNTEDATKLLEQELPGVEVRVLVEFDFDIESSANERTITMVAAPIALAAMRFIMPAPLLIFADHFDVDMRGCVDTIEYLCAGNAPVPKDPIEQCSQHPVTVQLSSDTGER